MARLVFPEFYEEGVENTPARILETHVHGSGILYRNCFQNKVFDFQQYDRLLPYAVAREDFEITARLVTGRLWFPHGLSESARRQYEAYVISERAQFAGLFVRRRDMRGIRFLTELAGAAHPDLYDVLTELAGRERFVEAVSFLMENRRKAGKRDKRRRILGEGSSLKAEAKPKPEQAEPGPKTERTEMKPKPGQEEPGSETGRAEPKPKPGQMEPEPETERAETKPSRRRRFEL